MPTTHTLRITLTDTTLAQLEARAQHRGKDLEATASLEVAAACAILPVEGRTFAIDQPMLLQLEERLGGGSVLNQADLYQKIDRLAGISFGHVRLDLTPGQLEEMQGRAERLGISTEDLIRRCAKKMDELFYTHLGLGV